MRDRNIIGIDLDNTIICYDEVFYKAALDRGMIPPNIGRSKEVVRDYLRGIGCEEEWIWLQGYVYGKVLDQAEPFPGVLEFFRDFLDRSAGRIYIVSHKTLYPFSGRKYNLHKAAMGWLKRKGFFDIPGFSEKSVFLETTLKGKIERIKGLGCSSFIDDLPEFLGEKAFPNIERILFDPHRRRGKDCPFLRVVSWRQIRQEFFRRQERTAVPRLSRLEPVLGEKKISAPLEFFSHGVNNRIYELKLEKRRPRLIKCYQRSAEGRIRFQRERDFLRYLYQLGMRNVPEIVGESPEKDWIILEKLSGRKLTQKDISEKTIMKSLNFIVRCNRKRSGKSSLKLPFASDACLSIQDHIRLPERYIRKLLNIPGFTKTDREMKNFLQREVVPLYQRLKKEVLAGLTDLGFDGTSILTDDELCVSPSDFGFQNCLAGNNGELYFLDFEYAGMDDPAKLVCDFFAQPLFRIPVGFFIMFSRKFHRYLGLPGTYVQRSRILLPLHGVKWTGILLKEFLRDRKNEAGSESRRKRQLQTATHYFHTFKEGLTNGLH